MTDGRSNTHHEHHRSSESGGRLQCQFCGSYSVERLFLASVNADSCECQSCGARWEEERASGRYLGRGGSHSVITNRPSR